MNYVKKEYGEFLTFADGGGNLQTQLEDYKKRIEALEASHEATPDMTMQFHSEDQMTS